MALGQSGAMIPKAISTPTGSVNSGFFLGLQSTAATRLIAAGGLAGTKSNTRIRRALSSICQGHDISLADAERKG